jgi:MFS family permease
MRYPYIYISCHLANETTQPFWLLFPFIFSALAFGGILVPKVNLILALICREYFSEAKISPNPASMAFSALAFSGDADEACRIPEVQERVSAFILQGSLISGILAAIVAPKLGALSDRFGRKPIMCITNLGMLLGEVLTILAAKRPESFPVKWLLLGYFFDGLCGSFIASMSLSNSYATDCTPPQDRNVVFGYFHGGLFTGIALGPLLAGYLVKWTGDNIFMFYVALGCHLWFLAFLLLFVPESLPKARMVSAQEKHAREMEAYAGSGWLQRLRSYNLFAPLKILYPTGPGSSPAVRRNLMLLASVDTIIFGVAMGAMSIIIIYSNYMFDWKTYEQSIFMTVVNTSRVFVLLVVLPGVTRLYRGRPGRRGSRPASQYADTFDLTILRVGIFFDALGFLGYTLSKQGGWFMASGALAAVGGMGSPTLQAAQTKHVPADRIGQLLGAMGLLHAVARVVAPLIFNVIYMATVKTMPQTVFIVLTAMFGLAFIVCLFVKPGGMILYFIHVAALMVLQSNLKTIAIFTAEIHKFRIIQTHLLAFKR